MPSFSHQMEVNVPIRAVWAFVSNIDHWAPLVPGYIEHQLISEKESTWCFKSDIGFMKKKIELKVDITSWQEPSKVTFNLTGLNEKFTGNGYFTVEPTGKKRNLMTGYLNIKAEGMMAKMANAVLNASLPDITAELTEAVTAKIEEAYHMHSSK
ncbi:carbon monoxide dehydrogenase subunit G [Cytobacillus eiseniae]|uniref:Carbon monoxide dehydrogenase subunit G n=1 Tax=Cytobacillus eiseniae TaxID=762947 RepID=A0ABS4RGC2_9BACI|nr:SRPBCC family protein [Cytobacillus eiseniae]MBP2241926.1 carbon monoxide dehydrogenase subunit G [Cytobacillus eiseniae]